MVSRNFSLFLFYICICRTKVCWAKGLPVQNVSKITHLSTNHSTASQSSTSPDEEKFADTLQISWLGGGTFLYQKNTLGHSNKSLQFKILSKIFIILVIFRNGMVQIKTWYATGLLQYLKQYNKHKYSNTTIIYTIKKVHD